MISLAGYQELSLIYESANSEVYRGLRHDRQSVILKLLKQDYPDPAKLIRYRQEYEILSSLNLGGVVGVYGLETYGRSTVIILEDFGAVSLKKWLKENTLTIAEVLQIGIQIADILGKIHIQKIIHKDINPANIVINPDTQELKIIDFGIASMLSKENPQLSNANILEGTLAYISPEQTGRMNRSLDYRTDFYSLGVTLYELLTGRVPFQSKDTLELIHCHLAKQPPAINLLSADSQPIPQAIANIVLKLMAKTPEDRYQSANGIKADLLDCWEQLERTGEIADFPLATRDSLDRFQIPQKLYGRAVNIARLQETFARIISPGQHSELFLVAGAAGVGKTALIQEIYQPLTQHQGAFIRGKFERLQQHTPYSALVDAFSDLIHQLFSAEDSKLDRLRGKILAAVGQNGQIIVDVIPELELIIGQQPPVTRLGAVESENRFKLVFQSFIRAFSDRQHPLVLFLDDLQWADVASFKLIELILEDCDSQSLLIIGAYRDREVSASHPLLKILDKLEQKQIEVERLKLTSLNLADVQQLIMDTLHRDLATVKPLAELVFAKTNGNPFFVNELLKTLYDAKLISYETSEDAIGGQWCWNLEQIKAIQIGDNVVDLMIGKLQKLPTATQRKLQVAACLGNEFDLVTLAAIESQTLRAAFADLKIALELGLIDPAGELDAQLLIPDYKFGHDRIQQAAYALIDAAEKQSIHLQIGRLELDRAAENADNLFFMVEQLNLGIELVTEPQERQKIAQLNWSAACRAKAATAYDAAERYLKIARQLLSADSWQTDYELTLKIYTEAAEIACLQGHFVQLESLAAIVLERGKTLLDTVKIYEIQIQAQIAQNLNRQAIETALPILEQLGISFSLNPTATKIEDEFLQTYSQIGNREIEDLIDLPAMSDRSKLAAMAIANSIVPCSFIAAPALLPLVICQQVSLSLTYGNTSLSANAYVFFGLLLCSLADDIPQGYRFGQLALQIVERFQAPELYANAIAVMYATIEHWQEHLQHSLAPLKFSYQKGLETGDLYHATTSLYLHAFHALYSGQNLNFLAAEIPAHNDKIARLKQEIPLNYHRLYGQTILNLNTTTANPWILQGESYDETVMLPIHLQNNDRYALCALYLNKLYLACLFREYSQAVDCAEKAKQYLDGATSTQLIPLFYFYDSLAHLGIYFSRSPLEQKRIELRIERNQTKLGNWAMSAPMNYRHKFDLVQAQLHAVRRNYLLAMSDYDSAIVGAKEHQYLNDEALANELAGEFYRYWGKTKIGAMYLNEAWAVYQYWGANAKVRDLVNNYPGEIAQTASLGNGEDNITLVQTTTGSRNSSQALDFASIMKASQAIAGEIQLDKLLTTLMQIAIENAGAQIGYLLLNRQDELKIEAVYDVATEEIEVLQSEAIGERLPNSVINYVLRTHKTVLASDASTKSKFNRDPYLQTRQTKSVLCTPLIDRGQLRGIIYLENNLTVGAFTPDRLQPIKLLSGQAAIAITNAKFYHDLQDSQRRLTQFIDAMPIGVTIHQPNGKTYYANHQAKELLGIDTVLSAETEELSLAYQIYRAETEELYPTAQLPVVRALGGETVKVEDIELHHPDKIVPIEVSTTPIYDQTGKIEYAIATFQDITARKKAEKLLADYNHTLEQRVIERTQALSAALEELQTAQKQLVESEKMASLGGLVAGIAHEINTPIGIGVTAASTLDEKTAEFDAIYRRGQMKRSQLDSFLDTALQSSSMILRNLDRAAELIDSFKQVAVDQSSESQRAFQLEPYLQEILITLKPKLKQTNHQIVITGDSDLTLQTYPGVLSQILTNLILNSVIHAYEPATSGVITIDFKRQGDWVKLIYADDGRGISASNLQQIFEPFFTTKRGQGGSGLGLHLVYNLVTQKLQGTIDCQSELGRGTTFELNFPVQI